MNNVVNGVNLQQVATAIIDVVKKDDITNLPDKSIIWCKTDFLGHVYTQLQNVIDKSYTLITHCSDHAITEKIFNLKPRCIKKWYAQNTDYKHPDLISLPIGIENHFGPSKGGYTDFDYFTNNSFDFEIKNKIINKIYCNFRPTHYSRAETSYTIQNNNIGIFENNLSFKDYSDSLKKYLFVASPRGNGIDAHRTWESLYYGCVPIVEKHFMYDTYSSLPIIQITSWKDVTYDFLKPYIELYKQNKLFNNTEQLTLTYWLERIKNGY